MGLIVKDVLKQARERAGLTQEEASRAISVSPITVSRWERGKSNPRTYQIPLICKAYAIDPRELNHLPLPRPDSLDPIAQLASLPFLSPLHFHQISQSVRQVSEKAMLQSRRGLLKGALASLVLLATSGATANYEDLLHHCSVGLAAAQEMSRSQDAIELYLAYDAMYTYHNILQTIAQRSSSHRTQALDLLARCALLKTILGWHCVGDANTLEIAKQAVILSKEAYTISGDPSLLLSAYSKLAWAYSYTDEDERALNTALIAERFMLRQDAALIPAGIYGGTYSTLALMQAKNEQSPNTALGKALENDPGDSVIAFMEFTREDIPLESGLIYYHAGNQPRAIEVFEQMINPNNFTLKIQTMSERGRLSAIHALAQSYMESADCDMEQIKNCWLEIANGAGTLQSEWLFNKARGLYKDMKKTFRREQSILGLREHLVHWKQA